jgi:cell division protein FtsB
MTKFFYFFVKNNNVTKPVFVSYFIAISVIFYFLFFTIFGQKGIIQLFHLKNYIEAKQITKQDLLNKVEAKKNMVDGMNPNSLDLDLVDEQSRKVLGYVGKNEVVIYQNK